MVVLEERFTTRPGDVAEQRCRRELIRYVIIPPLRWGTELRPASSRTLRDDYGHGLRGWDRSDPLTAFKMTKRCLGSSKIYGRLSPTTRSARDLNTVLDADKDGRQCSRWRSICKDAR